MSLCLEVYRYNRAWSEETWLDSLTFSSANSQCIPSFLCQTLCWTVGTQRWGHQDLCPCPWGNHSLIGEKDRSPSFPRGSDTWLSEWQTLLFWKGSYKPGNNQSPSQTQMCPSPRLLWLCNFSVSIKITNVHLHNISDLYACEVMTMIIYANEINFKLHQSLFSVWGTRTLHYYRGSSFSVEFRSNFKCRKRAAI